MPESQLVTETPVTRTDRGRTPREEIEQPVIRTRADGSKRETEIVLVQDISGSYNEPVSRDSNITKRELTLSVLPMIVSHLEAFDSQAAREQASGSSDKGGVLTITFNEPGDMVFKPGDDEADDERFIGDLNTATVNDKLAEIRWEGRTFIMPAIHAATTAFLREFGDRPVDQRPVQVILVQTDGRLNDADEFESWLDRADGDHVVAVAVVGEGPGHDQAVEHYTHLAATNQYLTVDSLTAVDDPAEVAYDLMLLAGKTTPRS